MENGERRVTVDDLIALAREFNLSTDELLDPSRTIQVTIASQPPLAYATDRATRIDVPQKNAAKFREVLLYILGRVGARPHIGQTVLYKLLYFIDFDYYERYEEQLIGATYIKNHHGPTPVEFAKIVEGMIREGSIEKVQSAHFGFPQAKYLPRRNPDLSILSARELALVDEVLNRLADRKAGDISAYSHGDVPWLTTEQGKPIEYEGVFYRMPPYSARIPDGEV
jgi:hypothetical protein